MRPVKSDDRSPAAQAPRTRTAFSPVAAAKVQEILRRYPTRQAALLPVLWLAQEEFGWISDEAIAYIAELLELPPARVAGAVSFYTMFHRKPIGKYHLQVCRNLSCTLRGASEITTCIENRLGIRVGETTPNGKFSLSEVECLASCGTAPMLQLNDQYIENLTRERALALIDRLARQ